MSWEKMVTEVKPCWCGNGTITFITEMDDWNRVRHSKEIDCPKCREKERVETEERIAKDKKRSELHIRAKELAESRYLYKWLGMYEGLNKKEAWQLYTGGSGYPALGTFYKHVKGEGVLVYMRWCFHNHFEEALERMGVKDHEIQNLLQEKNRI